MTDLRKLSEAATPGELHYHRPCNEIWAGADNEYTVAEWVSWGDGEYICALWNEHRSGSLIPRSEYERVLALLAEARGAQLSALDYVANNARWFRAAKETSHHAEQCFAVESALQSSASRIDDMLAAEPEARG